MLDREGEGHGPGVSPFMHEPPETRESLLLRLRVTRDGRAWDEFVAIYRPMIYRMARRRGMQDADAQDLTQTVLLSVARKIGDWKVDGDRARFRTWLARVARNSIVDAFRRRARDGAAGGTTALARLQQQPVPEDAEWDREYRRGVFRWAADRIRPEFTDGSWNAFWLTAVEGHGAGDVATQLGKSTGAVYIARSRIMRRLQEEVRKATDEP